MLAWRQADQAACEALYEVDAYSLSVQAFDAPALRQIDELVSGWYFARKAATLPLNADYAIKVKRGSPPAVPAQLRAFAVRYGLCHTDEERFYFSIGSSRLIVHSLATRTSEIWLNEATPASAAPILLQLFSYAIQAALRRCGLFELHAAGMSPPESDAGALIIGHSGSGKSTLALRLALSGWRFLSDDTLLLKQSDDGVRAQGFRRTFMVTDGALAACQSGQATATLSAPLAYVYGKWALEPHALFPAQFVASCAPRALFFSTLSYEARSHITELAPGAALARLIELRPWACADSPVARGYTEALARLAKQSVSYTLRAGLDLLREPELAAEIISARMP